MLRLFTAIPYIWLLVLFLVPFAIVAKISVSDYAIAIPPYAPTLDLSEGWAGLKAFFAALDFENFVFLTEDDLYWKAYLSSLQIAVIATFLTLLVGFPIAYGMARAPEDWRPALMMLVILPFWTSFLIRVYAWIGILSNEGFLNQFLIPSLCSCVQIGCDEQFQFGVRKDYGTYIPAIHHNATI